MKRGMNMNRRIGYTGLWAVLIALFSGVSCEKELDISEFSDEFAEFQTELRIEAIFCPGNPMNSIVRIDRTIGVDDTVVYNGRDDDGDWMSFSDDNNNGKWDSGEALNDDLGEDGIEGRDGGFPVRDKGEGNGRPDQGEPHIDEYDETLPLIHDSTAQVFITHIPSGQEFQFHWTAKADSFLIYRTGARFNDENDEEELESENVYYGAYRPNSIAGFSLECGCEYEFKVISEKYDLVVTGRTVPLPPAVFLDSLYARNGDTLYFNFNESNDIRWISDPMTSTYYVMMEQILLPDSIQIIYTHPSFPIEALTRQNGGNPIGIEPLFGLFPGLYRITVSVMDPNYGRYYYSDLALKDPQKSNLRDQNGNPVMGCVGSISETRQYIRIR